jgi:dTDP-4-dehydrorhamnose 3,5-epimerase
MMDFRIEKMAIPDVLMITHGMAGDARGFFAETYREAPLLEAGLPRFVQDNHARSVHGVLRGLHYQLRPAGIGKLVRCLRGRVWDVAVDIRQGSPTYARWVGTELSEDDCRMVYIPEGFAHAYCVLSETAEIFYKTTGYYSPPHDRGFRWNDPAVSITWPVSDPLLSEKDRNAPLLADADNNFTW